MMMMLFKLDKENLKEERTKRELIKELKSKITLNET